MASTRHEDTKRYGSCSCWHTLWPLYTKLPPRQALMDKWQHTTACDRSSHQRIEFFVPPNRQLQVSRCDALYTKIFRRIAFTNNISTLWRKPAERCRAPASSKTSAVRYSRIAEVYTAAFAPMRTLFCVRCFKYL